MLPSGAMYGQDIIHSSIKEVLGVNHACVGLKLNTTSKSRVGLAGD
jgi:hypothetical protein